MAQMSRSVGTGLSRSRLIGAPSGLRYEFDLGPARLQGGMAVFADIETADRLTGS